MSEETYCKSHAQVFFLTVTPCIGMAHRRDDLWREPFLLAVGYQSKANKKVANDLLQALLTSSQTAQRQDQEHDLLLAAECVIEAKPLSIDATLEKQIAGQLLQCYEVAQRSLACYSLECGTLITPAVVPLTEANYHRYEDAVGQWIKLRDAHKTGRVSERELELRISIHQTLLDCAEEVAYPTSIHLLKMLQSSAGRPDQPWQPIWQNYLSNLLSSGSYLSYQEAILLWMSLFPSEEAQSSLVSLLLRHYDSDDTPVQRYAERFLATLSSDLRDLRNLRNLRDELLTREHTRIAINRLTSARLVSISQVERVDLLTILLGRLLQIVEAEEMVDSVEREIQQIVHFVYPGFLSSGDDEIEGVVLDVLSYLPARSAKEILFVLQLSEVATDERVQRVCAGSLAAAIPRGDDAWDALSVGRGSKVEVVRSIVEERLKNR